MKPTAQNATPRLVLFPGMGADSRMYKFLRAELHDSSACLETPEWLPHRPTDKISTYAQRFVEEGMVRSSDVIGGSSFGGMVALELARQTTFRDLVLIGSCQSFDAVSGLLRAVSPLTALIPERLLGSSSLAPSAAPVFGAQGKEQRALFASMSAHTDTSFIRWACQELRGWRDKPAAKCPVAAIHGDIDLIIPPPRTGEAQILPGAGHLLAMSHPAELAKWLSQKVPGMLSDQP